MAQGEALRGRASRKVSQQGADLHGLRPRRAALRLIAAVLDHGRSLDAAKSDTEDLTGPERARAGALAAVVLRWLPVIDVRLRSLMRRPLERRAQVARDALRLALAEVAVLGVAPHAAVDAAVRLAKEDRGSAALHSLVNAVARAAVARPLALDAEAALPRWLVQRLRCAWGEAAGALFDALVADAPIDLTVRVPAEAADWAQRLGGTLLPTGSIRLDGSPHLTALPGYDAGAWWVQNAAAAIPARLCGVRPGEAVADLCAAPGGKTMQLAAAGAAVTAVDADPGRLARVTENLARTGLDATLVAADIRHWKPGRRFPAVLLDAPCSATGTLRRHPDLAHLRRESDIAALTALQDELLDAAWALVEPGGRLVFCTCSLLPEEGEARATAFLSRMTDARCDAIGPDEVGGLPVVTKQGWMRTRPDADGGGMDGFFAARFVRHK